MPSGSIHIIATDRISFFFKTEYCSTLCVCVRVHSSISRHLACLLFLAIVHNAAINMGVYYISLSIVISFSLDLYPKVGLLNHMVVLFFRNFF